MSLKDALYTDLLTAMKAKEAIKVDALRMVKAAIIKWEVADTKKGAEDGDVIAVLKKEIKQRKDAAEQFRIGKRVDLAEKEEMEQKILESYLPPAMTEEEITEIAKEVISKLGAPGLQNFGKVMGMVMGQVRGKADGEMVQKVVRDLLG